MNKNLDFILERFPEHRGKITDLFATNDNFRILCEDYLRCKSNLFKFSQNIKRDSRLKNEYKMLSLDLEQEVIQFLNG